MTVPTAAFAKQKISIDFNSLKHARLKGVYLAPVPDEPLLWSGVMFLRKGPYANAILRFEVDFPWAYPHRAPVIRFLSDVFHPLVTPLTTYTHTTRDPGAETVSAANDERLPPGGFSLRHGFPKWSHNVNGAGPSSGYNDRISQTKESTDLSSSSDGSHGPSEPEPAPHIVEVLQYLRVAFDTEAVLDEIPLEAAANTGAWHAWRSYRSKSAGQLGSSAVTRQGATGETGVPSRQQQQPGGARRPGEWNWQGVWEDRVGKSIQASIADPVLFGGDSGDVINFLKMDQEGVDQLSAGKNHMLSTK